MILKMKLKNFSLVFCYFLFCFPVMSFCFTDLYSQLCGKTGFFNPNQQYDKNRGLLLSSLASNVSARGGFYNASVGQGPDMVYAMGMCIQGAEPEVCSNCVALASSEVIEKCPNQTEGMIWPENGILCMVRYSNRSFFRSFEIQPKYILSNPDDIRANMTMYDGLWENITSRMIAGATSSSSESKYYAAESVPFTSVQNIYALMQCTPVISLRDCNICLSQSIRDFQSCCHGKQGGFVFRPSCVFRFEIYAFSQAFNLTLSPPSQPRKSLPPTVNQRTNTTKSGLIVATVVPIVIILSLLLALAYYICRRRKSDQAFVRHGSRLEITYENSLQFDFKTIESATDQFSERNIVGQGGFGEVFKAVLNGTEVAIKRLSKASRQGAREFKNEAVLVAKLQHRNLVRLLGFCVEGEEKILVYEFVANKSLDYFLFDPSKHGQLDWTTRYNIIEGIGRGVLYLHQDSRLTIIHRDLKASNILLDAYMNPKIADFGMARIMGMDQTQCDTNRIVGTFGYMAPEYAMHGHFSIKSDVYSFGVIILEIISGKKNNNFSQKEGYAISLVAHAWELWTNGSPLEIVGPAIEESYQHNEVIKCIHIALLCVQKDHADRPEMSTVILMLTSNIITLPVPREPGFFFKSGNNPDSSFLWSVDDASFTHLQPR